MMSDVEKDSRRTPKNRSFSPGEYEVVATAAATAEAMTNRNRQEASTTTALIVRELHPMAMI